MTYGFQTTLFAPIAFLVRFGHHVALPCAPSTFMLGLSDMKKQKVREYNHDPNDTKDVQVVFWKITKAQWSDFRKYLNQKHPGKNDYLKWSKQEAVSKKEMLSKGYRIININYDQSAFETWCKDNKKNRDKKKLERFALYLAQKST